VAVVLAFRVAIILAPTTYRLVKWEQAATGQPGPTTLGRALWDRLYGDESDEVLGAAVSEQTGTLASVTTFSETFELRRAQIRWGRDGGMAGGTDDAVTTHDFVKLAGGTPTADWQAADFQAVEAAFLTFWQAINGEYTALQSYKQVRWYKLGPQIVPPQAPVRIIDPASPGDLAGSTGQQPPQVAISITEKTSDPKAWGRFYLPAGRDVLSTQYGRIGATYHTTLADAADAMYQAFLAASVPAVVYSTAKPERETAGGGTLPAKVARALTVDQIQVDDLFDVIRSRRWNQPLLRIQRDIS
jgi:hypothetical protein